MPIDWRNNVIGETITDVQAQAFDGQAQLPAGASATQNEFTIVLGNGHTIKIAGIKLQDGTLRLVARDTYTVATEDSDTKA